MTPPSAPAWNSGPTHLIDTSGVPILVVCSTESEEDTCSKATAFKQAADAQGVSVTVSPQSVDPAQINSRVGASTAYTDAIESYIASIL